MNLCLSFPLHRTARHAALALLLVCSSAPAETLRVAVAANFKPTLEEINRLYRAQTGSVVLLSSASTGVLTTQLQHGAPFDIFFAADAQQPALLAAGTRSRTFCYAVGKLALAGGSIEDLAAASMSLAIANPVTAPYGRAALEVISRKEFSTASTRKLVRANNAAQAYQFWHSGAVDLALLPRALAPDDAVNIPAQWHAPIEQHAYIARPSPAVTRYLNWVRSDTVRSLIIEAGYESCP
ncbi:MAG: molybdate ABC transporter substrate-binding protein [Halioglobus sp.]